MKRKTIIEYVHEYSIKNPNKLAVMTHEQAINYQQLFLYSVKYSTFLKKHSVMYGDRIVLKARQTVEYVIMYLGIHLSGGVVVSLERTTPMEKMLEIADALGASHIIADEGDIPLIDIFEDLQSIESDENEILFPKLEDSADILFTTGTTGKSKGVELSHNALVATAENVCIGCDYKKDTCVIVPGPLNHANAIRKVFTSLVNGSSIYILSGMMDVKGFFKALDKHPGRMACCLPPAAIRTIFTLSKEKIGNYKDSIDFIESASAPLPETDKKKLCELLPYTRLYNLYGSSESASVCMFNYNAYGDFPGCIGKKAVNAEILIVDDDKKVITKSDKEHVGYIACKGDMNMKGYVNEPELTAETIRNGVVYTNDLGYIDDNGFIYIIGRKGDVINVGGMKVAPAEVESVVLGFDGIEDCICIGVEDRITGQALKLLVVSKKNIDFKELNSFLNNKLETYKVPKLFEMVEKVMRTYNGKIDRKAYMK